MITEQTIRDIIASQYRASLAMLHEAIVACPESLWVAANYTSKCWQVAYHVLFYTHLYLASTEGDFVPWVKHRKGAQYFKANAGNESEYSKVDILDYHAFCVEEVNRRIAELDFEAPSGFSWLTFNKLELQFYNIRHLQHHTAQLADRLRKVVDFGVDWVGSA